MANRRVLVNTLKHTCKRYNQQWPLAGAVPFLHNKHWGSEALIPNYNPKRQKVGSFSRAKSPTERSPLGEEFLKRNSNALVRAANSVVGTGWKEYRGFRIIYRNDGFGTSTAFRVGEGVYLTHNHHLRPIVDERVDGRLPVNRLGAELMLTSKQFHPRFYYDEMLNFSILTDKWSRKRRTARQVMNKTLQQARKDGIWTPARYYYLCPTSNSPAVLNDSPLGPRLNAVTESLSMGFHHDVGVLSVIEDRKEGEIIRRDVLYPSLKVRQLKNGSTFAAFGFPTAEILGNAPGKSQEELRALSASVGAGVLCCKGVLFGQETSEAIGVQNVINRGNSGGPLISMDDEPASFYRRCSKSNLPLVSFYISVDHPAVIASYLQFVLPSYTGIDIPIFAQPLMAVPQRVPDQIKDYLAQHEQFANWYVEVAWQRLQDHDKTERLKQHWSEYGNLDNPKSQCKVVPDNYDNWLGITFKTWRGSAWHRLRLRNETW